MNTIELAKAAERSADPLKGILSPELLETVKLGFIARWIDQQDEGANPEKILHRAREAIACIHSGEFA